MAWRNPRYAFQHAARDAGLSAITPTPVEDADFPADYLIDDRAGSLFKFDSSSASAKIEIDRGAGTLEAVDRILIPTGHNLGTMDIIVEDDDNSGFTSPATLLASTTVAAGWIDEAMTSGNQRYLRIRIIGTGTWEIPELIFTRTRTLTRGPEPRWPDLKRSNTLTFEKESGAAALLSLGPDRRVFEFTYRNVDDGDATLDLALLLALIDSVGTDRPFIVDPPFDTESALWMVRASDGRDGHEGALPAATDVPVKRLTLSLIEWLT